MKGASIEKTAFWISGTFNSAKAGVKKGKKACRGKIYIERLIIGSERSMKTAESAFWQGKSGENKQGRRGKRGNKKKQCSIGNKIALYRLL